MVVKSILASLLLLVLGGLSTQASAMLKCNGPTIKTTVAPMNTWPAVVNEDVGVGDNEFVRVGFLSKIAASYRLQHGLDKLPLNSTFKIVYEDGSRECARVVSKASSAAVFPVAGSQKASAGPMEVESTSLYIQMFQVNKPEIGWYTVCYDYYSNGTLTATECTVHPW